MSKLDPYTSFSDWMKTLSDHVQKEYEGLNARLVARAFEGGWERGAAEGLAAPRHREKYRLSNYTEAVLKVYEERDRLAAENRELTRTLADAVAANHKMHRIVDGIEELLTGEQ